MKTSLAAAAILLSIGMPAPAHRLDEYLQATMISVNKGSVQAQIRLIPGVAVLPFVLASIDTDADGVISAAEQRAYAEQVHRDLSLAIDGDALRLRLVSAKFPKLEEMKEGLGEIQLEFQADVPRGGSNRGLRFENHHQSRIAAYLVNCLVPRDPDIRVAGQHRNYEQSLYEMDYVQAGGKPVSWFSAWRFGAGGWLNTVALLMLARLAFLWWRRPV